MDRSRMSLEDFMDRYGGCYKSDQASMWVFGYGSLLWKPESDYNAYHIGYIENFTRRFNQGNETQRGTSDRMARVANIEEQKGAQTWGIAYQFKGHKEVTQALRKLYYREVVGGDYVVIRTKFHPRRPDSPHIDTPLPHPPTSPSTTVCIIETSSQISNGCSPIQASSSATLNLHNPDNLTSEAAIHSNDAQRYDHISSFTSKIGQDSSLLKYGNMKTPSFHTETSYFYKEDNSCKHLYYHLNQLNYENINAELITNKYGRQDVLPNKDMGKKVKIENNESKQLSLNSSSNTVDVLVFTVNEDNKLYLGSDSIHNMANQIMDAEGITGSNLEYVLKTSEFVKKYIPEDDDVLLFELDSALRDMIAMKDMVTEMSENELGPSRIIG